MGTKRTKTTSSKVANSSKTTSSADDLRLKRLYYGLGGKYAFSTAQKLYGAVRREIPLKKIECWLQKQLCYTLHKPGRKKFPRLQYATDNTESFWEVDLLDLSNLAAENDGIRYALIVIDCFSRFIYGQLLTRKTSKEAAEKFECILKSAKRPPIFARMDRGSEFKGEFAQLLKRKNIKQIFPSDDNFKCSSVERANRSILEILYKYLTHKLSFRYIEDFHKILDTLNSRVNRSIGTSPKNVNYGNTLEIWNYIQRSRIADAGENSKQHIRNGRARRRKKNKSVLHPGECVRVLKNKVTQKMDKGSLPNYSDEIFCIDKVIEHEPRIYRLKDLEGEKIEGFFYRYQLTRVQNSSDMIYRIEEILRKQRHGKITRVLVKFFGFKNPYWIDEKDLLLEN